MDACHREGSEGETMRKSRCCRTYNRLPSNRKVRTGTMLERSVRPEMGRSWARTTCQNEGRGQSERGC